MYQAISVTTHLYSTMIQPESEKSWITAFIHIFGHWKWFFIIRIRAFSHINSFWFYSFTFPLFLARTLLPDSLTQTTENSQNTRSYLFDIARDILFFTIFIYCFSLDTQQIWSAPATTYILSLRVLMRERIVIRNSDDFENWEKLINHQFNQILDL